MLYTIDDSRMPLRLGSALRVPSYAYPNWGINGDESELRKLSEEACRVEWEDGSPRQMRYVSGAMKRAGYGDFPQMLRNANAQTISKLVKRFRGKVAIADVGAGESTVTIFDTLDDNDKDRVHLTLIEPSAERAEAAVKKLRKKGFNDYDVLVGTDLDVLGGITRRPHIVSYVATLHHHAYFDTPLKLVHQFLAPKGFLTVADWHNPIWEHPNRVYEFLQTLEWETKDEDLAAFASLFPNAVVEAPGIDDAYQKEAMRMIQDFWRGWVMVRKEAMERGKFDPRDEIFMLEGHRPFGAQNHEVTRAGFTLQEKRRLMKGSDILMFALYQAV